jgi:Protein of unknown function (DUF5672)
MLELPNVTLVCVSSIDISRSIRAMRYSMRGINFGHVKLISHIDSLDEFGIELCVIDNIKSIDEYSKFMVYDLHKYINTTHTLIVQSDGFVINPNMWDNNFLNYDYIGAPWSKPPEHDMVTFRDSFGVVQRVGNGGFSLRSKKLLSLPTKLNLEWKSYFGYYNEDGFFCCHNRHLFEENGCRFAPIDVAKYFSHESEILEVQGIVPFGFHGKWSKYYNTL